MNTAKQYELYRIHRDPKLLEGCTFYCSIVEDSTAYVIPVTFTEYFTDDNQYHKFSIAKAMPDTFYTRDNLASTRYLNDGIWLTKEKAANVLYDWYEHHVRTRGHEKFALQYSIALNTNKDIKNIIPERFI